MKRELIFPVHLFRYDKTTGVITKNGKPVGTPNGQGYLTVQANKVRVLCHRLGWRLATGEWPSDQIDHINRNRSDNRICNLRQASNAENMRNKSNQRNCKSGERGVYYDAATCRWRVSINDFNRRCYFYASHRLSAILAARLIRRTLHGEFAYQQEAA